MDMKQMNVIATACIGGIIVAFLFMFDIYPVFGLLAWGAALLYAAFGVQGKQKEKPAEPWYMK